MHDDDQPTRVGDMNDGREVAQCVVGELAVERGIDRERPRRDQQRIAVGRGARDDLGAYDLVRARAVVDDDVLPDPFGYLLARDAADCVDRAAGRRRDHQPDRPLGIRGHTG